MLRKKVVITISPQLFLNALRRILYCQNNIYGDFEKDATNLVSARPSGGQVASGRVRSTKNFALHGGFKFDTLKHSLWQYCTHRGSLNFFPGMKIPQRQFLQTQSIKSADQQLGKHEMMLTY